jgi:hypothetical protein
MPRPEDKVLVNIAQSLRKKSGILARQDPPLKPAPEGKMTDGLIEIRCPQTGLAVQALMQERKGESRFEAVTCPACARLHFIDGVTGTVFPPTLLGPANWTP